MNPEEAIQAAFDLRAERVVGMHWGTFDLTDEALDEPQWRFLSAAYKTGLGEERAWILKAGESRQW
jgi:N-acyl-phosphatidylethanolamine-hydrolysing phospholipase D